MSSWFGLFKSAATDVPTPPAGKVRVFVDIDGKPAYKDDAGVVHSMVGADGQGVPAGGTAGQILRKASATDYDDEWHTLTPGDIGAQPNSTALTSIAGLTTSANQGIYTTAADTYATFGLTSAGRALLDDADAAAQRTTLGLGTAATAAASDFATAAQGAKADAAAVDTAVVHKDGEEEVTGSKRFTAPGTAPIKSETANAESLWLTRTGRTPGSPYNSVVRYSIEYTDGSSATVYFGISANTSGVPSWAIGSAADLSTPANQWLVVSGSGLTCRVPATFTGSVTSGGAVTSNQNFASSTTTAVLGTSAAGTVALRPNGANSSTNQVLVDSSGNLTTAGRLYAGGSGAGPRVEIVPGGVNPGVYITPNPSVSTDITLGIFRTNSNSLQYYGAFTSVGNRGFSMEVDALRPTVTNVMSLGGSSFLWTQVYAQNTAINSSDERLKTGLRAITDTEVAAFRAILRLPGVWQWTTRVAEEGDNARLHSGPTVQAAIAIMEANGLDWRNYGAFCYDEWPEQQEVVHSWPDEYDEEGNLVREAGSEVVQEYRPGGDRYSFRKEELLWWCLRAESAAFDQLEARVAALESGNSDAAAA